MTNRCDCSQCGESINYNKLFKLSNCYKIIRMPESMVDKFRCPKCGFGIIKDIETALKINQKQYTKNFSISVAVLILAVFMLCLINIEIIAAILGLLVTVASISVCVFSFLYIKTTIIHQLIYRIEEAFASKNKEKLSNNEYECQNCKTVLRHADIFKSKDSSEILAGFICPSCGFQVYPHFSDTVKRQQSKAWEHWFMSVIFVFVAFGLFTTYPSAFTAFLSGISFIVSFLFLVNCLIGIFSNPKIDTLDKQYQNLDNNVNIQSSNGATEFIDNLIKNQGIHFNRFLSYQELERNIRIDESLKNTLPEYVKQRILETGKGDLECLIDESVSTVKKLIFEDYHTDMAVVDEEIAQLYKCIPVNINALREALEPGQKEILTKTELREEMQYNLIAVNNFYSIQISEAKRILDFGVKEFCQYNFEDDIKILDNLKYYPDFKVDFDSRDYQERYNSNQKEAVEFFVSRILNNSAYPIYVKKEFELDYNPDNGVLALNYKLPNIENLPYISEVSYVSAKNDFKVTRLKEKELNELYDNVLYQIALRTNYEIFKSEQVNHIQSIVFNGYLEYVDKADGKNKTACILTMKADKHEFLDINLGNVEPKQCFKKFKGIGSNNLYNIIPVRPIINLNKADKRFIEGYEVMKDIEKGDNLAAMNWTDFENLVRELFEKEFSDKNGEVKITQSSRDGGVDAIVFLDDYLTGGKIIIQAKRYTNVVGVSAVRDLYGTMEHENAMKGIIITTSYYGSDSYEFAKDKPITLLDGDDLLNLLAKHGHTHARIDIEEAKALQKQQEAK